MHRLRVEQFREGSVDIVHVDKGKAVFAQLTPRCSFLSREHFVLPREMLFTTELNSTLCDLETSSDVSTIHRYFLGNKGHTLLIEAFDVSQASLQNCENLLVVVRLVHKSVVSNTGGNLGLHALGEVHGVRDGNDEESRVLVAWPVEQVVEQCLLLRH